MAAKKIKPPPPVGYDDRNVDVPPTVGQYATTRGDDLALSKTRANFRETEFVRTLRQHGKYVVWRKALLCPCWTEETEQAALDCQDCNGSGYLYVQPLEIQMQMLQFDGKVNVFEKMGVWQEGSVQVTTEPQFRLGYRDAIEMRDAVIPFNEVIRKGNRRGIRQQLPDGVDSARYRIRNTAAAVYKKSGGDLAFLEEDYHYTITEEGWIKWLPPGSRAVPDGTLISFHYDFCPIFLVVSWMHITRTDVSSRKAGDKPKVVDLPQQALAKLDFLLDVNAVPSMQQISQPTGPTNPGRERA